MKSCIKFNCTEILNHVYVSPNANRSLYKLSLCLAFVGIFATTALAGKTKKIGSISAGIVLTDDHLGPLNLKQMGSFSHDNLKKILNTNFPNLTVSSEIGSGDSPDYYIFRAKGKDNIELFSIISYIEYELGTKKIKNAEKLTLDLLTIKSPTIKDRFGIHVGSSIEDVWTKRSKTLEVFEMHHDVSFGNGFIWYRFACNPEGAPDCTQESIVKAKKKIIEITWPSAGWD
ncbi:MAG: hypothetical protein KBD78_08895 [Oligoflexales bacterium]|nr:hypothetical protein [Oligoflexales bacterium]